MKTTVIAAVAADGAIGRGGDLAFHISADQRRFKELTTGHTVIMGRNTFASLPKGALPNRRNIVVTRNSELIFPGAETAPSPEQAIEMARAAGETEAFIIGGGELYRRGVELADRLDLTMVDATAPGADIFFPEVSEQVWTETSSSEPLYDEKSQVGYRFVCFSRK